LARRLGRLVENTATEESARAAPESGPSPRAAPAQPGTPVLLVEDNRVNQLLATTLLSQAGYEIDVAWNGNEAIEAVQKKDYAVVLMDVQMPELDGFEASRRIRSLQSPVRDVPIIAMTANAMKGDRERCLDAGMDDYLSKPIDRATLLEKVAHWAASTANTHPAPPEIEKETAARTPQADAVALTNAARRP
jgi:CheY-like chemotaxis protein